MEQNVFAIVGNWGFAPGPKGISTYRYDMESGDLSLVETIRQDIAAGQLRIDQERGIAYVVDECGERRGEIGGGGYVLAFRIDPQTGKLTLINEKESLSPEPSYVCLDKSKQYLLACHCADPFHVTKIKKNDDGTFANEVLFDDTALVLFRLNEDGSLGDICDLVLTESNGSLGDDSKINKETRTGHIQLVEVISRQHCVVANPNSELFAVCDKGMDRIYTYRIDREKGKIIPLDQFNAEVACFPRYGSFHPTLPIFYANNENEPTLNSFHYDEKTGKLERFSYLPLVSDVAEPDDGRRLGAQDILVHPDGKALYVTLGGDLNEIVTVALDGSGNPTVAQRTPSGGQLPRGITISPDKRFLLSGNLRSGDITTFAIGPDYTLQSTGKVFEAVSPSAVRFYIGA